jgi:hypothetical protein
MDGRCRVNGPPNGPIGTNQGFKKQGPYIQNSLWGEAASRHSLV